MKSIFRFLLFGLAAMAAIAAAKTITFSSRQIQPGPAGLTPLPEGFAARYPAIWEDTMPQALYPLAFSQLQAEQTGKNGWLLKWPGKQAKLNPVLLLGRTGGKENIPNAVMEAVGWLISEGYYPERTLVLAFGDDESFFEAGRRMEEMDIRPEFTLAEGSYVIRDILEAPLAAIAIAEKGRVSFSMPTDSSTLSLIGKNPFTPSFHGAAGQFFDYAGPEMSGLNRALFANRWLFAPLLLRRLAANPSAYEWISSVAKPAGENLVSVSIRPGESIASCQAFLEKALATPALSLRVAEALPAIEPSPVSPTDVFGFQVLQKTVGEIFPGAIAAPALCKAQPVSSYFSPPGPHYRFSPLAVAWEEIENEKRPNMEEYARMVRFYRQLIHNSCL